MHRSSTNLAHLFPATATVAIAITVTDNLLIGTNGLGHPRPDTGFRKRARRPGAGAGEVGPRYPHMHAGRIWRVRIILSRLRYPVISGSRISLWPGPRSASENKITSPKMTNLKLKVTFISSVFFSSVKAASDLSLLLFTYEPSLFRNSELDRRLGCNQESRCNANGFVSPTPTSLACDSLDSGISGANAHSQEWVPIW